MLLCQFARYLAQEMQSGEHMSFDGEGSDDEEDDNGWLAHSNFDLRPPPLTARQHDTGRRPLSSSGFDVSCSPSNLENNMTTHFLVKDAFDPGPSASASAPYTDPFDDVS